MSSPSLAEQMSNANEIPSYREFVERSWTSFYEFSYQWDKYPTDWNFISEIVQLIRSSSFDFLVIFAIAIAFTIARYLFTCLVQLKSRTMQLRPSEEEKLPEASWKVLIYTSFWLLSYHYVFLSGEVDFYDKPCKLLQNISESILLQYVPNRAKTIYFLEIGFYLHAVFAIIFMDKIRNDFPIMMLHHALACSLLSLSYFMRFHKVGILVLYLHDISDIFVEFAKVNIYVKSRGGQSFPVNEYLANASFVLFLVSWFYYRLYLYPLKVLHGTTWCYYLSHRDSRPQVLLFTVYNALLYILLIINIYWFALILCLTKRIITGEMKEIEDIREEEFSKKKT